MVGHPRAERVVLRGVLLGLRGGALLLLVGPARPPRRAPARAAAALTLTALRETVPPREPSASELELVGRLVDRLQVALVLELLAGRRDVGVPHLRHAPARELDLALVERRLELQEEQRLLDVQHLRHRQSR